MDIKDKKPCKPGQARNPETGRCKKVVEPTKNAKAIKDKKPCKPGQVRNPETGRCKKVVEPKLKNNVIDPKKFFGKNAVQERNKARQSEQKIKKKAQEQAPKKKSSK